jgi:sulfotransferase
MVAMDTSKICKCEYEMKFNVLCGLPRSGSTLLCNVLSQNPRFEVSSTSAVFRFVNVLVHAWSTSMEVKERLDHAREETVNRCKNSSRGMIEGWYGNTRKIVFDKSRGWSGNAIQLREIYPDSVIIVMVRDLRAVFASVEKQHRNTALFDDAKDESERTMYNRADRMFSPDGLIGGPILGVEDMMRRQIPAVFIRYEDFVSNPHREIEKIYDALEIEVFGHSYKDVAGKATDPDAYYLYKYPHNGDGDIASDLVGEWQRFISPDLANTIAQRFSPFMQAFNYI